MRPGIVIASLVLAACSPAADAGHPGLRVVASTTLLASFARAVAGPEAAVESLVPTGAGAETYEPTPADVGRVHDAAVVVLNGAGLDGWFAGTIAAARAPSAVVVTCSDGLPVRAGNPHLWLDPQLARRYVAAIRDALARADRAHAARYAANARAYDAQLVALQAAIARRYATIPAARRAFVVTHDSWGYYAARFGLDEIGAIEERPGREPRAAHLAALVDAARRAHARVVVSEPGGDGRLPAALAAEIGARVVPLYDDGVGTNAATDAYLPMMRYDTAQLAAALAAR